MNYFVTKLQNLYYNTQTLRREIFNISDGTHLFIPTAPGRLKNTQYKNQKRANKIPIISFCQETAHEPHSYSP
ncbi:hypothetical protein NEIFLAOT_00041 [Neisseria flavescens NRL30031/H210]|uniref:Uncharacterized protein n=1 Tax=Neisseria flavescens NRL30031/H210 TaxID=546264 RepID=C0EJF3_NEIFL|nr:hypothetical protein NEIFLAOT_00041 [Neisseria flavescens NRL30031/H210]